MQRLNALVIRTASFIVPREARTDWMVEWSSELWFVPRRHAFRFCLGAYRDAVWLRRNRPSGRFLDSPIACLSLLAVLAGIAGLLYSQTRIAFHAPFLFVHGFMLGTALIVMSATSSLSLGEYPSTRSSPAHARRFHRRSFFIIKSALLVLIAFWGTFDLCAALSTAGVQPHATIVFYVIAFKWALRDQRRRCPVCLRLLTPSTTIGDRSHHFLAWYGKELYCARGHGLLHVPEIATTYDTQHWLDLDASWNVLFPKASRT